MKKEILIFGIIFLFIGIAVAPGITANNSLIKNRSQLTLEKETVDFTVEVCGLNGGKQTIELTKEEAKEVEQLFNSISDRLNKTETREESEEIFKEAVIKLDKYGLLGDLSIKQAQKLVTGEKSFYNPENFKNKIFGPDENENALCLIAGKTKKTGAVGLGPIICSLRLIIMAIIYEYFNPSFLGELIDFIYILRTEFWFFTTLFSYLLPLKLGGFMIYGNILNVGPGETYYNPANGWVYTIGLNGIKTWDGPIYGNILKIPLGPFEYYLGAIGFTGIKISPFGSGFYLGSALRVKLSSEPL